jgi:hypothetical protein
MCIGTRRTLLAGFVLATSAIGLADESAAHHGMHRHAPTARAQANPSRFEPARMIELRPGLFVSSYGCVTDEGQGRWKSCDSN